MDFWRENMPEGMFLRSGPDWHLNEAAVHTLAARSTGSGGLDGRQLFRPTGAGRASYQR